MPLVFLVVVAALVAGVIFFLAQFAGTTGNPDQITKVQVSLWLNYGLPVMAVAAVIAGLFAALSGFRKK